MKIKKLIIFTSIFLLILFPIVSAIDFNMKSEFKQGETLIAKISGNFLDPILKENIHFYRGHVPTSLDFYLTRINNDYYLYALLSEKNPANYSIVIENSRYFKGNKIIDENIIKNFTINNKTADFFVNPGFIKTNDNFFIEVQNLQDFEITINKKVFEGYSPDFTNNLKENKTSKGFFEMLFGTPSKNSTENYSESFVLSSGEIKKINFNIDKSKLTKSSLNTIELSSENSKYSIPIFIFTNTSLNENEEKKFQFDKSKINITLPTNSNITQIIHLYNRGNSDLENITLFISNSLKPYLTISTNNISKIRKNSSRKIELYFNSLSEEKIIEGQITAKSPVESKYEGAGNVYVYSAVFLNFVKDYQPLDNSKKNNLTNINLNSSVLDECSKKGGDICNTDAGEECTGSLDYTSDGLCCLSGCIKPEESSKGKIIGWGMIILIIILLAWFFKFKYRGAKKQINLLKIGKRK